MGCFGGLGGTGRPWPAGTRPGDSFDRVSVGGAWWPVKNIALHDTPREDPGESSWLLT